MTRTEFAQGIALLNGCVGKSMPDEQVKAWFAFLGELTVEQLKRGIVESLKTHHFAGFPPVGTIRTNALAGVESNIVPKDRPILAWQAVRDAVRRVGAYDSPNFADPVINAVIRELGGWPCLCDTPGDEMHWLERRFCAAYSALAGANLPEDQTKRLVGITEIDNARSGYRSEPVRVADVACLTAPSEQTEPVRLRLETPESTQVNAITDEVARSLSEKLQSGDQDEAPETSSPTETSERVKFCERTIVELEQRSDRRDDELKAG